MHLARARIAVLIQALTVVRTADLTRDRTADLIPALTLGRDLTGDLIERRVAVAVRISRRSPVLKSVRISGRDVDRRAQQETGY